MRGNSLVQFLEGLEAVTPPGYSARVQATYHPQGRITRCALTSHLNDFLSAFQDIPFSEAVSKGFRGYFVPSVAP
jgi:hypothetical protein